MADISLSDSSSSDSSSEDSPLSPWPPSSTLTRFLPTDQSPLNQFLHIACRLSLDFKPSLSEQWALLELFNASAVLSTAAGLTTANGAYSDSDRSHIFSMLIEKGQLGQVINAVLKAVPLKALQLRLWANFQYNNTVYTITDIDTNDETIGFAEIGTAPEKKSKPAGHYGFGLGLTRQDDHRPDLLRYVMSLIAINSSITYSPPHAASVEFRVGLSPLPANLTSSSSSKGNPTDSQTKSQIIEFGIVWKSSSSAKSLKNSKKSSKSSTPTANLGLWLSDLLASGSSNNNNNSIGLELTFETKCSLFSQLAQQLRYFHAIQKPHGKVNLNHIRVHLNTLYFASFHIS